MQILLLKLTQLRTSMLCNPYCSDLANVRTKTNQENKQHSNQKINNVRTKIIKKKPYVRTQKIKKKPTFEQKRGSVDSERFILVRVGQRTLISEYPT